MAGRLVLALLAVAFGVAVIGATITTLQHVPSVNSAVSSGPPLSRRLHTTSMVPRDEYKEPRS